MLAPRVLHHLPILHAEADLGSLAHAVRDRAPISDDARAAKRQAIDRFWQAVADYLDALPTQHGGHALRIYQDALPVCQTPGVSESRLVADLAAQGSRNHQLIAALEQRGAVLVGTESAELLVREYELARAALAAERPDPRREARQKAILELRDRFIADRIAATLPPGGAGVLLLGALHDPLPFLPRDFTVDHPLGRPGLAPARSGATHVRIH